MNDAVGLEALEVRVVDAWQDWWLACEAGWFPLLARLGADLDQVAPDWSLMQAKSKFGVLRFYASVGDDDTSSRERFAARVAEAEAESARTCERCGRAGSTREVPPTGWLATLCDQCAGEVRGG